MKFRSIALAAVAVASFGAQAGLVTYDPWNAAYAANGLAGVKFNVVTDGNVTAALGAHAYKNGAFLPSDSATNTFYAQPGLYEANRANWSFDFAWDLGNCTNCRVVLKADVDPTAGVNLVTLFDSAQVPNDYLDSWNMEMGFINAALSYDFNPYAGSSTAFALEIRDGETTLANSAITVNVPEPGSMALVGLALAGMGLLRRRKA